MNIKRYGLILMLEKLRNSPIFKITDQPTPTQTTQFGSYGEKVKPDVNVKDEQVNQHRKMYKLCT